MIHRDLHQVLLAAGRKSPVISVTGPRQSGKTTLVKAVFNDYTYLNFEDPDLRSFAIDDPVSFLRTYGKKLVLDEAQHVPQLFSYLQLAVDEDAETRIVLTGSQNLLLHHKISQNPRIYHDDLDPGIWLNDYIQTYLERDVRQISNITDLHRFQQFLKLCAGHIGQMVNFSSFGNALGISYHTVQNWLSVLEASYIVFRLYPFHKNFNKRLVKTPKLYFYDSGLASVLLGLKTKEQAQLHFARGALFENLVIAEMMKNRFNAGFRPDFYFWRDNSGNEVDLIIDEGPCQKAVEIKSSRVINTDFFKGLDYWRKLSGDSRENLFLVVGGTEYQSQVFRNSTPKTYNSARFLFCSCRGGIFFAEKKPTTMKRLLIHLLIPAIILVSAIVSAQKPTQTIRGTIVDKQSLITLPGANVIIPGSNPPKGASSAVDGSFKITGVDPGRYDIQVTCLGYKPVIIANVVVTTGKEVVLDVAMEEEISNLKEVVVSGTKKHETINQMAAVSARSFSMEEVNRFAGGRSDPSRLVSNFAGVSAPNDSRNDIVIRGNSPMGVLWRIEGLTVPNPNHFVTIGTTGGPVSALNPNALSNSDFFTSAFPADYGNANAGVFDIHFRNGNTEKNENMIQFGAMTGLEAMAEGPFSKKSKATYLVAYRYSFTGLAQNLGIPIGTTATPKYQDLTFKLNSGETKLGQFTLFGLGGTSKIAFLHGSTDSTDIYSMPGRDSYSSSTIGVLGLQHFIRLSKKIYMKSVIGITYSEGGFTLDTINASDNPVRVRDSKTKEIRYGINSFVDYKVNARLMVKGGIQCDFLNLDLRLQDRQYSVNWVDLWQYQGMTSLLSAYAEAKYHFNNQLTLDAGLRGQFLTLNSSKSLEPRLGLKYQVNAKNTLGLGFGIHSQMQPLSVYYYRYQMPDLSYNESNRELDFTRSMHFVGSYETRPLKDWRFKTEIYYQRLYNVPVSVAPGSFSMLNEGASFAPTEQGELANNGSGTNYGIELTAEKFFSHGYYGLITGSLYQAKYTASDQIERNTAFNGNFVYNILAGKEFRVGNAKRNTISFDARFSHAGGRYYTPVDLEASKLAGKEVLMGDAYAFSERYPDFLRLDFKAGFTYNSKKRAMSQTFYIDLQNVTGHRNIFMEVYNPVTHQINTLYQIGFYPNFVYRIQF